jgi:cytochrome c-type biogenesis protein CcmH
MSPRDWFWFLAGALVTVAIVVALRPWLRGHPAQTVRPAIPAFAVPIAAALALIGVALGIYFLLGSPQSIASAHASNSDIHVSNSGHDAVGKAADTNAGSLDEVTQKLATRLATQGGSDGEWQLLAESYDYMGRTADAKAARAHIASVGSNDTAEISGSIDIASKLASHATPGTTLFVYAKQPNAPGPPLAVVRLRIERWPVTFTLNDSNAMVPGRSLSTAQSVQIEARISRSGDAIAQTGDLVGTVTGVNPRAGQPVKISIDRQIG